MGEDEGRQKAAKLFESCASSLRSANPFRLERNLEDLRKGSNQFEIPVKFLLLLISALFHIIDQ